MGFGPSLQAKAARPNVSEWSSSGRQYVQRATGVGARTKCIPWYSDIRVAENLIIGVVYAEPILATPTALPQSNVVGLVWLAALVLAIVILGFLWSGYLALSLRTRKPKQFSSTS